MSCSDAIKNAIQKTIAENTSKFSFIKPDKKITVEIENGRNDNEVVLKFYIAINAVNNSIGKKFIISKTRINKLSNYETDEYPKHEEILNYKLNTDDMYDNEQTQLIADMDILLNSSSSISYNKSLSIYVLDIIYQYRKQL